jgi:L-threonylcarbamoyladenylate synthase
MIDFRVKCAVDTVRQGGVIAYPTEAVWGLGCDPRQVDAIEQLLALKQRPADKGLILVGSSPLQFAAILEKIDPAARQPLLDSWPGPVTWVVPHFGLVSDLVSGGRDTVAIRVSNHPLVCQLCEAFGGPLVSTSANPTGLPAARSSIKVRQYFANKVAMIVEGSLGGLERPTEIRVCGSGSVLRSS